MSQKSWPKRGYFGSQVLLGPFQTDPADMVDPRGYFGLISEGVSHYTSLRDEEGHLYSATRRFPEQPPGKGGRKTLIVQSTRNSDNILHFEPRLFADSADSIGAQAILQNGELRRTKAHGAAGKSFEIVFRRDSLSWSEEGVLNLTGSQVEPGLQWYLPLRDVGMLYVTHLYQVAGELDGRKVHGWCGVEHCYMVEGGKLYSEKEPLCGPQTHTTWYSWGTRYKDGSVEAGHFASGHDLFGFAIYTDGKGRVVTSTNVDALIKPGQDRNFPEQIVLTIDNVLWEFIPDPRGKMPDFLGKSQPATPQNEGIWRRVGETREPESWFAWGEIAPSHGLIRTYRSRFGIAAESYNK